MALSDFQFSLAGVTFGRGTVYHVQNVTGLGLGAKRGKVFANPGADGVKWGREYRDGNTITWEAEIRCDGDPAAAWAAMKTIRTAFAGVGRTSPQTTQPLVIRMPGDVEVTIQGRPDQFDPALSQLGIGRIPFNATFVADTPVSL